MLVVGVDGCPGGWLAIANNTETQMLTPQVHATFAELVAAYPEAACIGVDIPIGLAEGAPRECDLAARRVLGARRSSVFPAPDSRVVAATDYANATALSRRLAGKGVSRQAFGIYAKVHEVNRIITPELQQKVVEVHPEVSFWALAGDRPMAYRKKVKEGFEERRALLTEAFGGTSLATRSEARSFARPAAPDDVLDAIVACWTARRYARGTSGRLPEEPQLDARGLRMEIVF